MASLLMRKHNVKCPSSTSRAHSNMARFGWAPRKASLNLHVRFVERCGSVRVPPTTVPTRVVGPLVISRSCASMPVCIQDHCRCHQIKLRGLIISGDGTWIVHVHKGHSTCGLRTNSPGRSLSAMVARVLGHPATTDVPYKLHENSLGSDAHARSTT